MARTGHLGIAFITQIPRDAPNVDNISERFLKQIVLVPVPVLLMIHLSVQSLGLRFWDIYECLRIEKQISMLLQIVVDVCG